MIMKELVKVAAKSVKNLKRWHNAIWLVYQQKAHDNVRKSASSKPRRKLPEFILHLKKSKVNV